MSHVVLLGDSIFDNAIYVPGGPPVVDQVRGGLPAGWTATLAAVDGDMVADVPVQLRGVPAGATHLVVSVGGNDALQASGLLQDRATTVGGALATLAVAIDRFRTAYCAMLRALVARGKPVAVCTIYDAIPTLGPAERAALSGFNDVITRAAVAERVPLIDLRAICSDGSDYSPLSPIEPSVSGGAKIAAAVCRVVTTHNFAAPACTIYV